MRTQKQLLSAIQNISITGKGMDDAVQSVGLEVIQHVEANGEVSLAIKLLKALPKGARSNALVEWFIQHGKISVNKDKATGKQFPLVFDREKKSDLQGAADKPWFKCRPERDPATEFDLDAALAALVKRAQAAKAAGMTIKGEARLATIMGVAA